MGLLQEKIRSLFGYEKCEASAPRSLMAEILQDIFPELEVVGLVAIGSEGALLKAKRRSKFFAVKIASLDFKEKQGNIKIFGIFKFQRETTNSHRVRFLEGCRIQQEVANSIRECKIDYVMVPDDVEIVESPWLAVKMEFVDGIDILRHLNDRKSFRYSMELYCQLLRSLEFIHSLGIVHRDIKPENILVAGHSAKSPKICILDWTLAKVVSNFNNTLPGVKIGTLPYASSKMVLEGQSLEATETDDVFSVGVMLYEFCSTKKVPKPANYQELLYKEESRTEYLKVLSKEIHPMLLDIFLKATDEDESRRYPKITPMRYDFEEAMKQSGFFEEGEMMNLDFSKIRIMVLRHELLLDKLIKFLEEKKL